VPHLDFNGESIAAEPGEALLQAARRHGSHVWFLCDGRGICQSCECHVLSGAMNLSEPSGLERLVLSEERRRRGYRLGCQARLTGLGAVSVVSRAEEMRKLVRKAFSGAGDQTGRQGLARLGAEALSAAFDLATGLASAAPHAFPQLVQDPPTPVRLANYARDTLRLAQSLWRGVADRPRLGRSPRYR
jgi:ferredoxin